MKSIRWIEQISLFEFSNDFHYSIENKKDLLISKIHFPYKETEISAAHEYARKSFPFVFSLCYIFLLNCVCVRK